MIAFEKYREIEVILDVVDKHRMWLKDYEGLNYSIAVDGKHLMKWKTEPKQYSDKDYDVRINCIGRKPNRTIIEFDGDESEAKENLEITAKKLKEYGYGFIRSTHKGKSDYLWVEFNRDMKDKEIEQFLFWIAPKGSKIDLNFASSNKVFPVLFAVHWKHSYQREIPIEFHEGNQIDFDALKLSKINVKKKVVKTDDFEYEVIEKDYTEEEIKEAKQNLKKCYIDIINLAKEYIEMPERYYKIIALWIIGTYVHKKFNTFPFLFINAMKGSGKTRLLKFLCSLVWNGDIVADLKEAVLFRTAENHTILIDEFESIGSKDKGILRELLNAAYKKGIKVKRMKKVKTDGTEKQEVEEFNIFTPIAMANIWGMDEVLNDRCITIILEKSSNSIVTRMVEDFDFNVRFNNLKRVLCSLCSVVMQKQHIRDLLSYWNDYLKTNLNNTNYTSTLTTLTPQTTQTTLKNNNTSTQTTLNYTTTLFKKIYDINIDGRNLELFFPLFLIANCLDEEILDDILNISKEIINEKREDEFSESKDISLIDFISHQIQWQLEFIPVKMIVYEFRQFLGEQNYEDNWLNERWVGRALKRLGLIASKRRLNKGTEIILNVAKAKEKIKLFKSK